MAIWVYTHTNYCIIRYTKIYCLHLNHTINGIKYMSGGI